MFENLQERLGKTLKNISGRGRLTEDNIKDTLREVRMAFLEADVALPVVRDFVKQVKERAVGVEVTKSLTPGQVFVKIVREELEKAMGEANEELSLNAQPPAVVMMAGLQGAGKTTMAAKLALHLRKNGARPLLVAADVYRPAAIDQLQTLGKQLDIPVYEEVNGACEILGLDPLYVANEGVLIAIVDATIEAEVPFDTMMSLLNHFI